MLELRNVFEDTTRSHEYYTPLQPNLFYVDIFNDYGDGIYCKKLLTQEPYKSLFNKQQDGTENKTQIENNNYIPPFYLSTSDMDGTLIENNNDNLDLLDIFVKKDRLIKPCISANYKESKETKTIKINIKMNSSLRPNIGNVGDGIDGKLLTKTALGQDSLYITGEGASSENTNGQLYIRKDIKAEPAYLNYNGKSARVLISRINFNEDGLATQLDEKTRYIKSIKENLGTRCNISWRETIDFAVNNFHKDWINLFYNKDTNSRFSYEVDTKYEFNSSDGTQPITQSYNTNYRFASFDKDMLMFRHIQEMRALLFKRIIITLPKQKIILKGVFPNINSYSYDFNYGSFNSVKELTFSYNYRSYEIVDNLDGNLNY